MSTLDPNTSLYTRFDINQDAQIDILDIILVVQCVLNKTPCQNADMNDDDSVNVLDIIALTSQALIREQSDFSTCIDEDNINLNQACTREYNPVCGCDQTTYSNPCIADSHGITTWTAGECPRHDKAGCTYKDFDNFDPTATRDDGSCMLSCGTWFDGCNTCSSLNNLAMCTRKYCLINEAPYVIDTCDVDVFLL